MFSRVEAVRKEDVFLPVSRRSAKGVYFLRLAEYSGPIGEYIWRFHEEARQRGAIIEGQIGNPDDRQLSYYQDILGSAFRPEQAFVSAALQKWTPRMSQQNKAEFTAAMCRQFDEMRRAGKNENIQKNVYIKMMCWLYYRFERLMPFMGQDDLPKVLYEGNSITNHELIFLRTLSSMGVDILLLETKSDDAYLRLDPESRWSQKLHESGTGPFPADYSLKSLRKEMAKKAAAPVRPADPVSRPAAPVVRPAVPVNRPTPVPPHVSTPNRVNNAAARPPQPGPGPTPPPQKIDVEKRFQAPGRDACTNAWMKKTGMTEVLQEITEPLRGRGDDNKFFYNAFVRVNGVPDKLTYVNELYQFYQKLTTDRRKVLVIDGEIPKPEQEELEKIRRRNYRTPEELIIDLAGNLPACAQVELQRSIQRAFVRTILEAAKTEPNLNRLKNTTVYILCWIQRYQAQLFQGWKETEMPCLIKMGACATTAEALYIQLISQLPADVLILCPSLNETCEVKTDSLLEIQGSESLPVMKFPKRNPVMVTVAGTAQDEIREMLAGSGIHGNFRYGRAETITLQTTYDEIFILWDVELPYRPNFSTGDYAVNVPVLYAKVSGVEDGKTLPYWQKIKLLLKNKYTKDSKNTTGATLLVEQMPIIQHGEQNRFQSLAVKGIKNEKIKKDVIKADRQYPFGLLREEMQEHIFDKLQQILDQRIIKGTFSNGTEYTILATVLNMKKELLRLIQNYDFTRKNPKIVAINTRDQAPSLEDAIMLTFLNKLGFDIVLFVPTGYQTIERYLNDNFPVEHHIGEFVYDLPVPDFDALPTAKGLKGLISKIIN